MGGRLVDHVLGVCAVLLVGTACGHPDSSALAESDPLLYYVDQAPAEVMEVRTRRTASLGINVCLCCSRIQLTFCCEACIRREELSAQLRTNPDTGMSLTEQMLSRRVSNLRVSACSCCARNPDAGSRCCTWCGSMRE